MTDLSESRSPRLLIADPFRCRVWALNARIKEYVTETTCHTEIESVRRGGQLVPIIGRILRNDRDFDVEVICGTRRLFIARYLKIPVHVDIQDFTEREAAFAVEAENALRRDISPYERGLWLARLLKEKIYRTQDEMARELGITSTQLTRLLKFSELPESVIRAFPSPHCILESWAVELHKAWRDERRKLLTERSLAIAKTTPRPPAVSVYETMLASRGHTTRIDRRRGAGRVVKSQSGTPLLRLERQRKDMVLRIPNALVDISMEKAVTDAVVAVLTGQTPAGSTPGIV